MMQLNTIGTVMRILVAGHFRLIHYYMPMQKLMHGFVRLGHNVMHFDDRTTARMSNMFRSRPMGAKATNAAFVETVNDVQPELILLSHCEMFTNETLADIKQKHPDTPIVYYNVDALSHYDKNVSDIARRKDSVIDAIFSTTAGEKLKQFASGKPDIYHLPNPVDPHLETGRAFEHKDLPYDMFFASGVKNDHNDMRWPFLQTIEKECLELKLNIRGYHAKPFLFGADYQNTLAQCKMGLNISRGNEDFLYSSDRMSQYLGNGLLTFLFRTTGFNDYYNEDEVVFFDNAEECAEKLKYYSANDNERMLIAQKGWEKATREYHADVLCQYIIERAFGIALSRDYHWPTEKAQAL